jgi:hypothetical protein
VRWIAYTLKKQPHVSPMPPQDAPGPLAQTSKRPPLTPHCAPGRFSYSSFFAWEDLAISRRKASVEESLNISLNRRRQTNRTGAVSASSTMASSTRDNPRTPRIALAFAGKLSPIQQVQSGHGSHARFNLGEKRRWWWWWRRKRRESLMVG